MDVEWDPVKARVNVKKHGVTFEEAASGLRFLEAMVFPDPVHSTAELRQLAFTVSSRMRYLVISFTQRNDRYRIISARRMTNFERKQYAEGKLSF